MNFGFTDLLLYLAPIFTVIFTCLLLTKGGNNDLQITRRYNPLLYVHYSLLFALLVVTIYSVIVGSRPFLYFLIVSALFITSVLIGRYSNTRSVSIILFITAVVFAVSVLTAVIVGNDFYPFNSFGSEPILQTGSIETYQNSAAESGLYYYIPVATLIEASIALVTGQTTITPFISNVFFLLAIVAGLFVLIKKLSHSNLAAIISVFFLLSIPTLTFIGRMFGLLYAIFYILFILLLYKSPRVSILCLWIVSLPMIFDHPAGFVAVLALLLPLALLGIKNWPNNGMSARRIRLCLLTTIVAVFAYWSYTYLLSMMTNQGVKFYSTVYTYFSGVTTTGVGQDYVSLYNSSGYEVFAYAWVIPVALSGALIISFIFKRIKKKKFDPSQSLIVASAFAGLAIVFIAYLSYPRGETGQYLIIVGYFLLLLSSSVVAAKLVTQKSKKHAGIIAVMLAFFVLVGTCSPDWAPLEHPDFETAATIHPFHSYLEAGTVAPMISTNSTVYYDYDFPIGVGSYKPVRSVITQIDSGIDPDQFANSPVTLYGVREESLSESAALQKLDAVYSSGFHTILIIEVPVV